MTATPAAIVVHGGAGPALGESRDAAIRGCRRAASRGWRALADGVPARDAATAAVRELEENPAFNAGRGAALNADGQAELDASVMTGEDRCAGAVAAVRHIRHPVELAREVLRDGRHVLMVARGAERFAERAGMRLCRNRDLITAVQRRRWSRRHGTVGCVALDAEGGLAAATSTGGKSGDLPGRVGDSALIGAGTYATERAAVSATGIGEAIIRTTLARDAELELASGDRPARALQRAIAGLESATGGEAGLIAVGRDGRLGWASNAACMPVCGIDTAGVVHQEA